MEETPRLPTVLIIGAQKSGTTTLQRHLRSHPEAWCVGETHFFDFNIDIGLGWYLDHFRPYLDLFLDGNEALARWLGRDLDICTRPASVS